MELQLNFDSPLRLKTIKKGGPMKRKLLLIPAAAVLVLIVAILLLPTLVYSGGCPPNEDCPSGTDPRAVSCWTGSCNEWEPTGYCILCAPKV